MARITVEDCTEIVQNRFELVTLAARRGKDISSGAPIFVSRDNDKNAVIALREIAARRVEITNLRNSMIQSYRKHTKHDVNEELEVEANEVSEKRLQDNLGIEITEEIQSLTTIDEDDDITFVDDEDLEIDD